jgi:hypothetical protein
LEVVALVDISGDIDQECAAIDEVGALGGDPHLEQRPKRWVQAEVGVVVREDKVEVAGR